MGGGAKTGGATAAGGAAIGNDAAGKGGGAGIVGIANGGGPAAGGRADAGGGEAAGAAFDGRPITRVNSPGASGIGGKVDGGLAGLWRGSRLSVNDAGDETGVGSGAGVDGTVGGALVPAGVPPPKIRVNSPGAFCDGDATGSGWREGSEGGASGLRNKRVNSPG